MESFDIWEAANIADNDSDGNLLAEYLKKKTRKVFTRRIFEQNGNKRVSIEVCLSKANGVEKENTVDIQQNEKLGPNEPADLEDEVLTENYPKRKDSRVRPLSFDVPLARSPLASYMKRTPHSSDRLRRSSIRRLIHRNSGRRTLLDQFNNAMDMESTSGEFAPHVASTPVYPPTQSQPTVNALETLVRKNITKEKEAASSPRRYTIEKGECPGQLLLTPVLLPTQNRFSELLATCNTEVQKNKHTSAQNSLELVHYNKQQLQTISKIANGSDLQSVANPLVSLDQDGYEKNQRPPRDKSKAQKNTSRSLKKYNNFITTTNDKIDEDENLLENEDLSRARSSSQPKEVESDQTGTAKKVSDNVTDMITDDDEPESRDSFLKTNNLEENIIPSKEGTFHTRTQKIRKKQTKNAELSSEKSDGESAPSYRMTRSRKCFAMNKAPRTPINGEKYAPELKKQLAGLSNLEVLDLRKRNSSAFSINKSRKDADANSSPGSANCENIRNDCVNKEGLPNAPDSLQPESQYLQKELFQDERSCDRVSFFSTDNNVISHKQKAKRGLKTPEIYKSYKNATQQVAEVSRKLNESKRSLYSNANDLEIHTSGEIVPPPPMLRSSTPRKLALSSNLRSSEHKSLRTDTLEKSPTYTPSQKNDDALFKKPKGIPLKQKKSKSRQNTINSENINLEQGKGTLLEESSSLRRSNRCRKEVPKSLFWIMWEKNFLRSMEDKQKRKLNAKSHQHKSKFKNSSSSEMIPIACSTANMNPVVSNDARKKTRTSQKKTSEYQKTNVLAPITQISKSTEKAEDAKRNTKRLRVKVQRLNDLTTSKQSMVSSSLSPTSEKCGSVLATPLENQQETTTDHFEPEKSNFLTWLKGLTNEQIVSNSICQNPLIQMSLSTCNELTFTSFNDVDYAFYNTKEKNFLGYMRFQPRQIKPPSRAKQHNLHFLILSGAFKIISNEESGYSKEGDLVSINQGCRYSIENISDDVGILFFVKK